MKEEKSIGKREILVVIVLGIAIVLLLPNQIPKSEYEYECYCYPQIAVNISCEITRDSMDIYLVNQLQYELFLEKGISSFDTDKKYIYKEHIEDRSQTKPLFMSIPFKYEIHGNNKPLCSKTFYIADAIQIEQACKNRYIDQEIEFSEMGYLKGGFFKGIIIVVIENAVYEIPFTIHLKGETPGDDIFCIPYLLIQHTEDTGTKIYEIIYINIEMK